MARLAARSQVSWSRTNEVGAGRQLPRDEGRIRQMPDPQRNIEPLVDEVDAPVDQVDVE